MKKLFILIAGSCFSINAAVAQAPKTTATVWPAVTKEMRPWTRWWWMGNAVDDKNTARLLESYNKAGFGGVEVTPIYGAIGYESRYLQFLSPQWMSALEFTVNKAKTLGMGVDMNTGTGWPFGGPQIKAENAAAKLIIQNYKLTAGQALAEKIAVKDPKQKITPLQTVTAYGDNGEVLNITDKVATDGTLNWKPEKGNWDVYAAFTGKTLQQVKRAAPGGEGNVMDHLSKESVNVYLKRFDDAFKGKPLGIGSYFNDSYEVYGASWSPVFFDEFKKYRGYDLRLHLRELVSTENTEAVSRVKSDYRETMSQMLLDNFTLNWTNWAHKNHSLTRNQSHGSPGNLLDLYGSVDIPECETFGSSKFDIPGLRRDSADVRNVDPDPIMLKFASSAAHVNAKPYTTSETFTWLAEHFKGSLSQTKPELEQVFLSGVNHVYFHGTTYSPDDIAFPGWLFYASTNFVPDNSWWSHLSGLNNYIARCQSILQAGKSDNEIILYWPIYDAWAEGGSKRPLEMPMAIHDINEWLRPTEFYKTAMQLQKSGYAFDFISDKAISASSVINGDISTVAGAQTRKVLVVPASKYMPLATLQNIIRLAKSGATVIFEKLPLDIPGLGDLAQKQQGLKATLASLNFTDAGNGIKKAVTGSGQILLSGDVQKALEYKNLNGEALVSTGLKFIRRQIAGGKYYYLVNHTANTIDTDVPLNTQARTLLLMDPQSGSYGVPTSAIANGKTKVHVQLRSGEALVIKATNSQAALSAKWKYIDKTGAPVTIGKEWALHFTKGGPELPADQTLSALSSWTNSSDPKTQSFSGSGEYTTTFDIPTAKAAEYVLNLGKVCESAHVYINGADAGIFWSIPFSARVGKYLKSGKNTIKVEVDNLMANRIRYMDQNSIQWRKYHEINFVNIDYKPFDASKWTVMPSGLLGPVTLTPVD